MIFCLFTQTTKFEAKKIIRNSTYCLVCFYWYFKHNTICVLLCILNIFDSLI